MSIPEGGHCERRPPLFSPWKRERERKKTFSVFLGGRAEPRRNPRGSQITMTTETKPPPGRVFAGPGNDLGHAPTLADRSSCDPVSTTKATTTTTTTTTTRTSSCTTSSYRLDIIPKNVYTSRPRRRVRADDVMVCDCSLSEGCSENCINRMMFVECDPKYCPCGDECKNCRFQKREYAEVTLMEPKDAKGFGLMTRQALKKGQFVIEYVGEVVNEEEHNRRKVEYRKEGKRHFYFMSIANGEVIDATRRGNLSRFLNHSCNPNCETQKWQVGGELCIGIFALRDVDANTELTFDYHPGATPSKPSALGASAASPTAAASWAPRRPTSRTPASVLATTRAPLHLCTTRPGTNPGR